jgi:hypothetical protein
VDGKKDARETVGIIRLFVGSQGDALNWRTGQSRPLKEGEFVPSHSRIRI